MSTDPTDTKPEPVTTAEDEALAREALQAGRDAENEARAADGDVIDVGPGGEAVVHPSATLGVERWVYLAFFVGTSIAFWMLKNLIVVVWDRFDEPDTLVATLAAIVLAVGGAFATYRNPRARGFAHEVAEEYGRITWPTREEAMNHTVVVITVSLVATVILAVFDYAWGALSDLLYQA